jgi:hypothetical protein
MRELEGRSYQEIAEILGVSVSAVETLIFRARRALREQLEDGITCHDAELAISKQLDDRLPRKEKGPLRAHLRECEDCAGFARSQRAQRGALKALGAIPLPSSLVGLFGSGGAAVGGGLAVKAAVVAAGAVLATGVTYEGVKQGIVRSAGPVAAPAGIAKQHRTPVRAAARPIVVEPASVIALDQEARHDQKPFSHASVKARRARRARAARSSAVKPERLAKPVHKEVSALPPSRVRGHDLKPTKPAKTQRRGNGQGQGHHVNPPKPKGNGAKDHGNGGGNGGDNGSGGNGKSGH